MRPKRSSPSSIAIGARRRALSLALAAGFISSLVEISGFALIHFLDGASLGTKNLPKTLVATFVSTPQLFEAGMLSLEHLA